MAFAGHRPQGARAALAAATSKELGTGVLQRVGGERGGGGDGATGPAGARDARVLDHDVAQEAQALGPLAKRGGGNLDAERVGMTAAYVPRRGPGAAADRR